MAMAMTVRSWLVTGLVLGGSLWVLGGDDPADLADPAESRARPAVLDPAFAAAFGPAGGALYDPVYARANQRDVGLAASVRRALDGRRARPLDEVAEHADDVPETIEELVERIEMILLDNRVPGAGIALVDKGGVLWSGGVGIADRRAGTPVTGDTVFRSGSVSKSIIALAVMTLVEDGRVRLDAPLSDIIPDMQADNPWSDSDPITLAHVLEHTAGFDDMRFNETFVTGDGAAGDSEPTLAEALARNPRSRTSRWRPGSRHAYSNPGYTVAAHVVETIAGVPFERYVEERILRPAGMATASFTLTDELRARLATGYDGLSNQRPQPVLRLVHRPAGELLTSARELAGLVHLLLNRGATERGRVVSEASLARMERGQTRSFPDLPGTYGLGIYGDMSLPVPGLGHNGGLPGFASEYRYFDQLGLGYVMLLNATGGDVAYAYWQIRDVIFAYLTRWVALPEPPETEVSEDELRAHIGAYELASPRHELLAFIDRVLYSAEVVLRDGQLVMTLGNGAVFPLVPMGGGQFRTPWASGAFIEFDRLPDGTRILALGDAYYEEGDAGHITRRRIALGLAMRFMDIGFFWNIIWLPGWLILVVRFRQYFPLPKDAVPGLACACFLIMQKSFIAGASTGALGYIGFMSVTFWLASMLFPLLSALALYGAIRGLRRNVELDAGLDELVEVAGFITQIYSDDWRHRLYQLAAAIACVGLSGYLLYHGVIGLRTWAW